MAMLCNASGAVPRVRGDAGRLLATTGTGRVPRTACVGVGVGVGAVAPAFTGTGAGDASGAVRSGVGGGMSTVTVEDLGGMGMMIELEGLVVRSSA